MRVFGRVSFFLLLGGRLTTADAPGCPWPGAEKFPGQCAERRQAWEIWSEVTKQALGHPAGVPRWQPWCDLGAFKGDTLEHSTCDDEAPPKANVSVRESHQATKAGSGSGTPISIHMNPVLARGVLMYAKDSYKTGWVADPPEQEGYVRNASKSEELFPFGEKTPRQLPGAGEVVGKYPVAVKASWHQFSKQGICEKPEEAKIPVFSESAGAEALPPARWANHVLLDFSGTAAACSKYKKPRGANVALARFHWYLEGDEIRVLTGLHVMSRVTKDWVWATFWWSKNPTADYGADRPAGQPGPWNSYVMATTRHQNSGSSESVLEVVFNPFLEAAIENGRLSNCVNCHRLAALGRSSPEPACTFPIPTDILLSRNLDGKVILTDYLWSLGKRNGPRWNCDDLKKRMTPAR